MEYVLLFFWSFLSSSVLPVPSEPYFVGLIANTQTLLLPVMVATIGNTLGSLTTFFIGQKGGKIALKRMSDDNKERFDSTVSYFKKYGPVTMIVSWVPIIGDFLVGVGGALRLPVKPSVFWIIVGKLCRYILLGLATLGLW